MPKTFKTGRRLQRLKNLAYLLFSAEVFVFYLLYRYLLAENYPALAGGFLLAIFLAVEAAVLLVTRTVFQKAESKLTCTVGKKGITVTNFIGKLDMPWEQFEAAYIPPIAGRHPCPVCFTVSGKRFMPNRYYENIAVLDTLIVEHIRDHAEIEDGIDKALEAYRALKV